MSDPPGPPVERAPDFPQRPVLEQRLLPPAPGRHPLAFFLFSFPPGNSPGRRQARLTYDSSALSQGSSSQPPSPGPLPRSTPAHRGHRADKPPYLPVPHFGKYGHRGFALLATGPRRAWAVGLHWARSLESLRQILLFFTCSPTSHLVIKSWVATCRRMRASPGIHSASPSRCASRS